MNMAKAFYKLLVENKNLPADQKDVLINSQFNNTPPPKLDESIVLRRRSVGTPTRTAQIGIAADPIVKVNTDRKRNNKRSSQRLSVRLFEHHTRSDKANRDDSPLITPIKEKDTDFMSVPGKRNVVWDKSPSATPVAKKFQVESNKSVTQILESLKNCFADMGQYDISAKQTKNGIKVKARRSGKRHGTPVVTLNLKQKEKETASLVLKSGGKYKEEFIELAKKVEETLEV